jgi:outer membrane protein assembly factor BamB
MANRWASDHLEKKVGTGYSAPSVLGNRLVLDHRVDGDEIVECMEANDAQGIWELRYQTDFSASMGFNDGPICTPLLADDRCYTFGAKFQFRTSRMSSGERSEVG